MAVIEVEDGAQGDGARPGDYPIAAASRAKVLIDYKPEGEYRDGQLALSAGDVVYVHQKHQSGWWGGHKAGSNLTGWFPATIVETLGLIGENEDDQLSPVADAKSPRSTCASTSTPLAALRSPLVTVDKRAVASPQAARISPKGSTGSAATSDLLQTQRASLAKDLEVEQIASKELRGQLLAAREHSVKCTATVEHLQAEMAEVRAENGKFRDQVEFFHSEFENFKQAAKVEVEVERQRSRQLQERCEAQEAQIRALEAALKDVTTQARSQTPVSRTELAKAAADRASPRLATREAVRCDSRGREDAKKHTMAASLESRSASSSLPRRLFAAGSTSEDMHQQAGAQLTHLSTLPARYIAASNTPSHAFSSQMHSGAPPRPTPRGQGTPSGAQLAPAQTWTGRAHYVNAQQPASSPAHVQTGSASPRHAWRAQEATPADRMPAVRALVSEFERRSTSQTPGVPGPRSVDPSPSRRAVCTGPQTPSAAARVHSASASARRPSPRMVEAEPAESPPSEDHSSAPFIIGMSPMQRTIAAARISPAGTAQSPVQGPSVQDRIRQLYGSG
mmetsp:Transcript_12292/g.28759  ORF Transcript_12292/g.28759 Transcript_12292/m.28759 type:complete len:564 (-) Transcript_12292:122-1813(-)